MYLLLNKIEPKLKEIEKSLFMKKLKDKNKLQKLCTEKI